MVTASGDSATKVLQGEQLAASPQVLCRGRATMHAVPGSNSGGEGRVPKSNTEAETEAGGLSRIPGQPKLHGSPLGVPSCTRAIALVPVPGPIPCRNSPLAPGKLWPVLCRGGPPPSYWPPVLTAAGSHLLHFHSELAKVLRVHLSP